MLTDADKRILEPLGGPIFAEKAANCIIEAVASIHKDAGKIFDDVEHCDAIGEMCRAKVNEGFRFLAQGQGYEVTLEKPRNTRYDNPLIRVNGTVLTIARAYGQNHLVKCSGFRNALANPYQMTLDLYGEGDRANTIPGEPDTSLILAWDISTYRGRPSVTFIELQEVLGSPQWVKHRIDLLAAKNNVVTLNVPYIYDDVIDVTPKVKRKKANDA